MSPQVLSRVTTCLNLDILQSVIEFVNKRSDVLTLSLLSSSVHPMAIRRLLRMGPIKLQNEALVRGFHVFLSADPASRGPHVRTLDIWTECIQEMPNRRELECIICDILAWYRNLHGLFLGSYGVSHCPGKESPLQAAFEGLKTLRELSVCGREDYAPDILLKKIRSPISVLRFDMHNLRGWRCTPSRINTYIAHLIPTLRILELGGTLETEPASRMAGYLFPCSSVSSLTIRRLDLTVDLSILVRWLPALKCLEVGGLQAATQWTEPEDYHRAHLRNKHRQRDCSWARLRRHLREVATTLSCEISTLQYILVTSSGYTAKDDPIQFNVWHGREEWLRSGGWRLFKDSHRGMRRMEELDDRLAMSLIAREEMGLSETDQERVKGHSLFV